MKKIELAFYFEDCGKPEMAEGCYLEILAEDPQDANALHNLGRLYHAHGFIDKALLQFRKLVKHYSDSSSSNTLANILLDVGRAKDAMNLFINESDKLMASTHIYDYEICKSMHEKYGEKYPTPMRNRYGTGRIGFISPDFNKSTVMDFFLAVLSKEHYCYHDSSKSDELTAKVQQGCASFTDVYDFSDQELHDRLEKDKIDYVIDLAGHFDRQRRDFFGKIHSYNYIRYVHGTGVKHSVRISDGTIDPWSTQENILKIKGCCFGYTGEEKAPLSVGSNKDRIYGSLNRAGKFSDDLLKAWAGILEEDQQGILKVLCVGGEQSIQLRSRIIDAGIQSHRLQLVPTNKWYYHFVSSCDVILDSYAYSGVTTTCDALWAGVPVVTLSGYGPQSRVGASLLRGANLGHLVADSVSDYIALASGAAVVGLSGRDMREHVRQSPLMDGSIQRRFTEALYGGH